MSYFLCIRFRLQESKSGGGKVSAKSHADYINREGAQGEKVDCVYKGSQLPKWAKGSPQRFFDAATRYEDKGNRRYKEIELSLPNELTLEQNREIVDKFIANHVSNHYYAYAIHEKTGELSGESTPHVHIMFSILTTGRYKKICKINTSEKMLSRLLILFYKTTL